jgi:hypothetical protein
VLAKIDGTNYNTEWVNVEGDYLPLAGGTMDTDASIYLSTAGGNDVTLSGTSLLLTDGENTTNITYGEIQLNFEDVATPFTINANGITFPDATVQTTAFAGDYLPLTGGTMTGPIYFGAANSYITNNAVVQSVDYSEGGTVPGDQYYATYGITGLTIRAQNWSDNGEGGVNPPTLTYGSALTGYGLSFVNFNGSSRASTMLYGPTSITFGNASVQTIAFPGFNNVALTGTPTAPTPATSDNDTSIATTAYVKAQDFGDRYLTTSTTSNTVSNGNKTFTIGTGLSYTPTQNITISYNASNHMHGEVLTYSTSTGVLTVNVNNHTGSGTYTAWVVNVGGVTPATSVAWGAITGTLSAQTDLQSALDLKANLASPTFTGTPSLPTGTTAVTQTAGNNTTALATTAFVTTSNPDASTTVKGHVELATDAEALTSTSTTLAITPSTVPWAISSGNIQRLDFINNTAIAGSGIVSATSAGYRQFYLNTTGSVGRASFAGGIIGSFTITPGFDDYRQLNFSKKMWLCGKFACNVSGFAGDAHNIFSVSLGGYTTGASGNMTVKGIGLKKVGGAASFIELVVHNGTSQSTVATTKAVATSEVVEWMIYSDGTGNVTLYINGTQEATSSAGPTGTTANGQGVYREQVEQTASAATRLLANCYSGQLIIQR